MILVGADIAVADEPSSPSTIFRDKAPCPLDYSSADKADFLMAVDDPPSPPFTFRDKSLSSHPLETLSGVSAETDFYVDATRHRWLPILAVTDVPTDASRHLWLLIIADTSLYGEGR